MRIPFDEALLAPGGGTGVETNAGTEHDEVSNGQWTATAWDSGFVAHVYANGTLRGGLSTTQVGAFNVGLPVSSSIQFPDVLGQDVEVRSLDIHNALAMTGLSGNLAVQGKMDLILWNVNLTHGDKEFWSGRITQPTQDTGSPLDDALQQERRQLLIANLEETQASLSTPEDVDATWYGNDLVLQVQGTVTIPRPLSVPLGGGGSSPLGQVLSLHGSSTLRLDRQPDGLHIEIQEADSAFLDGQEVSIQSVIVPKGPAVSPWLWIPPGLAVVGLGVLVLSRSTPTARLRAMERHLEKKDYSWVVTRAGPALRSLKNARRAALYKATSLLALRQFQEARLFLADLPHGKRPDPATYHFLTAHAAAGAGQVHVARRELAECLEIEPSYEAEAETIPELRRILRPSPEGVGRGRGEAYA